jgi:hypothetical protein
MFQAFLTMLAAAAALAGESGPESRCGWLHNPTPANWWLIDRDGEWSIAAQGGYQAPGMDRMPDMTTAGWIETNGHNGYGCGCLRVRTDRSARRITQILSASPRPLRQCQVDRSLRRH